MNSITPTNINVRSQSVYGSAQPRPVRVANELIYLQRAAKKVRSMQYDFNTDSYRSQNLTRLASHITGPGVVDMAFQAEPNPVVWMVRSDGVLVSMTYDADDSVCGFTRNTTDGLYKSVAVIPGADGDVVFVLVQRTINGQTVQYVEQLDQSVMTDAAIIGASATPEATWSGLGALEGKACDVKADGVYMGQFTVAGGQITLPRTASAIEVGLHYDTSITTLSPQVGTAIGTSQSNAQRAAQVVVRVLNTTNMLVGDQRIVTRQFGSNLLDKPPPVFTGDLDITEFGWARENELAIGAGGAYVYENRALLTEQAAHARDDARHANDLNLISKAALDAENRAIDAHDRAASDVAAIDAQLTQEKKAHESDDARNRALIADGSRRLRIAVSNFHPTGSQQAGSGAGAAGVGNGASGTAELSPAWGSALFGIFDDADSDARAKADYLQRYVRALQQQGMIEGLRNQ